MKITLDNVCSWANALADQLLATRDRAEEIYPIPRGGLVPAFALLVSLLERRIPSCLTEDISKATIIIDDIVDTGDTMAKYQQQNPSADFVAVIRKDLGDYPGEWIEFPWDKKQGGLPETIESNVRRLIEFTGDDPSRPGLAETPTRVAKAYKEWFSGYSHNPNEVLKTFEDGADGTGMVSVGPIPFYSHCEHHMAPFFGEVYIGYIPNGKILGLSKFARLVEIYSNRLQVQERLTGQIAEALWGSALAPLGVIVKIKARHLCMESRGVKTSGSITSTVEARGNLTDGMNRAEFLKGCE